DYLPSRFFEEPLPRGPSQGQVLSREGYEKMLQEYYRIKGWDESGIPKKERLVQLGLDDVAIGLHELSR
ncbi:MAG: aldehyde ferredoxin oxidoreductase C-terminal domain-containing protein, partial [Nitrososphaerota archaeon]